MLIEADAGDLRWSELDAFGIAAGVEVTGHGEAGCGLGLADEANDGGMIDERDAGPLLADFGEEPVLDWIPLGGAGGIVADGDEQAKGIGESVLQGMFPQAGIGAVAAAVIGEDEQAGGFGIAAAAVGKPPAANRLGREGRVCCWRPRRSPGHGWLRGRRRRRGWQRPGRGSGNRDRRPGWARGSRPVRHS